ncbi:MAG: class I SAM-dependent methyltransferase [Chitinophagaceae bacterium]
MLTTERFSNRVENYVKYRPHYPEKIVDYLTDEINFSSKKIVADIGSGTGILTELFLQNKNIVYAVEPNAAMRLKAEELLNNYSNFISVDGTAEHTKLENKSIDLIVAAQAFHWFDAQKTKQEFQRIAKQNAYVFLIWNERMVSSDFEKDYENLLLKYATDYTTVDHRNIYEEKIAEFFQPNNFSYAEFENEQIFDFGGLKGRLLSSSYIPNEHNENFDKMIKELHDLFQKHAVNNKVGFDYKTKLYFGKVE